MKKRTGWLLAGLVVGMVMFSGISVSAQEVVQEQVIWEEEDVILTASGIIEDEYYKYLQIHAENNGTQDVTVVVEKVWVNGAAIADDIFLELPAREAVDKEVVLSKVLLNKLGIDTVASIEFNLTMLDTDSYDVINSSDLISLITEGNEAYEQIYDESGDVIYDANGVKIIFKGTISEYVLPVLAFFTENYSDNAVTFEIENVLINGAESDVWTFDEIANGRASLKLVDVMDAQAPFDSIEMHINVMDEKAIELIDSVVYQNTDPMLLSGNMQTETAD